MIGNKNLRNGHVYFVLHQKRTIPRKGFEIGFCKEGWHDFPWRRPFRGSTERFLCWRDRAMSHFYREGRWRMVKMVENAYEMKEMPKIGWKKWKNYGRMSNLSWMGHSVELGSWNSVRMSQKNILNLNPSSDYSQIGVFSLFWRNLIFQKICFFLHIFHMA